MSTWETVKTIYRVTDFTSWQRAKNLILSPSFQRRPVWKPEAKSYLIDTVVRGLPMPIIFLREQKTDPGSLEPKREVVDGQQRIRTIFSYIDPSLLNDFQSARDAFTVLAVHNEAIANKGFSELPPESRRRILDYEFSVHVLPASVDDREVLQVFARMNSTGVKLNSQELRNAEYFGAFKTSMYEIASEQLPRWRDWGVFTEYNIARMEEVELISEFALLMLKGLTGKSQAAIGRIYKENDFEYPERIEVEKRLRVILDTIDDRLGRNMRFLPFRKKTLFYTLFAFFYDLQFGIGSTMESMRPRSIPHDQIANVRLAGEGIQEGTAPATVLESAARRTTNPFSRSTLLKYFHGEIKGGYSSS